MESGLSSENFSEQPAASGGGEVTIEDFKEMMALLEKNSSQSKYCLYTGFGGVRNFAKNHPAVFVQMYHDGDIEVYNKECSDWLKRLFEITCAATEEEIQEFDKWHPSGAFFFR